MIDLYEQGKRFPWWRDWRGECVAIVASGPSAKTAGVEKLRDRIHVVVINDNYRLCPWADILYACDPEWLNYYQDKIKKFRGTILTLDERCNQHVPGPRAPAFVTNKLTIAKHRNIWVNDFLFKKAGEIGSGGNSGFQMINLVAQFGTTGIALVGFDMQTTGGIHWHGKHPSPLRNPDHSRMYEWRKDLDEKSPKLKMYGIDVVNCSKHSALTAFPKMTIDEMLERWSL